MLAALNQLESITDIGETLIFVRNFARGQGVLRQSYHFTPVFDSPTSERTAIFTDGFDPLWVARYEEMDFRQHDPIPERTLRYGARLTWRDAMTLEPNTPEQETFFEAMEGAGLKYGFGLPLFGAGCRDAYASYDFGIPLDDELLEKARMIRTVAQAAQIRVCRLLNEQRDYPVLSDRERQVLYWMAQGKSTTDIGTILGLSPETIRTYGRRVFEKLNTNNRIGAIIRGLKLQMIWL